jgi:3D (Asp-Asp-Asp) domain-containing protein
MILTAARIYAPVLLLMLVFTSHISTEPAHDHDDGSYVLVALSESGGDYVDEVVIDGHRPLDLGQDDRKVIYARVTAYAPLDNQSGICADSDPTNTSIMLKPGPEYVAVDPKKIPYGTKLMIPGYGEVAAGDTGAALRNYEGYAIDVYFDKYEDAKAWGVQYLEVEIIESEG